MLSFQKSTSFDYICIDLIPYMSKLYFYQGQIAIYLVYFQRPLLSLKRDFLPLRLLLLKASCYDIPFQLFFDLKNMFLSKARVKCHFQKKNNFFKKRRRKIKFWNELKIWFKNSYGKKSCVITNYIMNKIPLCQPIIFLNKRKRSF